MGARGDTLIESYLVRERDCLVAYADFSPVFEDLDLHILSAGLAYDPFTVQVVRDGLAALGLHVATRPPDEYVGWTVHVQEPLQNFFFTGDSETGDLVGRAFVEGVEPQRDSVFICESKRGYGERQLSSVPVTGVDIFAMVETYYRMSEQVTARFFHRERAGKVAETALILALPGADERWLRAVGRDKAFQLRARSEVPLLARRPVRFRCGCDGDKIGGMLAGAYGETPEALFGDADSVEVECPRCAAAIRITREQYDRFLGDACGED